MAMQAVGGLMANESQSRLEEQNADFLRAQADYARAAGAREEKIARGQFVYEQGIRAASYAAGNIDVGSLSAVSLLAGAKADHLEQVAAIRYKTAMDVRLASERAAQSESTARMLKDPLYNVLSLGGPLLSTAAGGMGAFKKDPTEVKNTATTVNPAPSIDGGGGGGRPSLLTNRI
jgi:hypothetical protein